MSLGNSWISICSSHLLTYSLTQSAFVKQMVCVRQPVRGWAGQGDTSDSAPATERPVVPWVPGWCRTEARLCLVPKLPWTVHNPSPSPSPPRHGECGLGRRVGVTTGARLKGKLRGPLGEKIVVDTLQPSNVFSQGLILFCFFLIDFIY